jgi:hypothetical protein
MDLTNPLAIPAEVVRAGRLACFKKVSQRKMRLIIAAAAATAGIKDASQLQPVVQVGWLIAHDGGFPSIHPMDTKLPTRPGWVVTPCFAPEPATPG